MSGLVVVVGGCLRMSDADDYESLPESTPLSVSVLAGATAGVAEHCVMFPVDSVKVSSNHCRDKLNYLTIGNIFVHNIIFFTLRGLIPSGKMHRMHTVPLFRRCSNLS